MGVNYQFNFQRFKKMYDPFKELAFFKKIDQCLPRIKQILTLILSAWTVKEKKTYAFKSFIYVCLSNLKLNKIHSRLSYSKYGAHITADIKHHYTPSDPPVCLIFSKIDVSAHYRSSLLSTQFQASFSGDVCSQASIIRMGEGRNLCKETSKSSTFAYPEVWFLLKHLWYPRLSPHRDASLKWQSCCCCFYSIALPFYRLLFLTLIWRVFTSPSSALIPR